jgi:hypothetical protein
MREHLQLAAAERADQGAPLVLVGVAINVRSPISRGSEAGGDQRAPKLVEVDRADHLRMMSYRQALQWAGSSEQRLRLVAAARGYKAGWVWHRMQEIAESNI